MNEEIRNNEELVREEKLEDVSGGIMPGEAIQVNCKKCGQKNFVSAFNLSSATCSKCKAPLLK